MIGNREEINMTQLLAAQAGRITPEMHQAALLEKVDAEFIRAGVAAGTIVIIKNTLRENLMPCAVGSGLRTKVNALIGTSSDRDEPAMEVRKIKTAAAAGADAIMDLSTGGDIDGMRHRSLAESLLPVGSVPVYQAAIEAVQQYGSIMAMTPDQMLAAIARQAADGVDFMAIHSALNFEVVNRLQHHGRVTDIVSRGGAFLTAWMLHHQRENPLYQEFDQVLRILRRYDVVLSLGDAVRPGCIADSLDGAQVQGLLVAGELVSRARAAGVQVMVEGPGHVPLHHVETTVVLQKQLCHEAPYFVLGTLATDVAPGYDHITAAIGGALAGVAGADFICYVTPAEHLGLPTEADVKEGVIAARIAAHAVDLVKRVPGAWELDQQMARARASADGAAQLRLALDADKPRCALAAADGAASHCRLCGDNCALRLAAAYFAS